MPPPTLHYASRTTATGFDPSTLSDNDDDDDTDDARSISSSKLALNAPALAFTDGVIAPDSRDLLDWKISRIGGRPVFPPLSTLPPVNSGRCQHCGQPMPLIAQVYCPLETSSLERVVYTFSCPRKSCRGKPGSTRAWRANVVWAEAIEQQQKKDRRKEEQAQARQEAERGGSSGGAGGAGKTQLDLGSLIFGGLPDRSSAIAATSSSTSAAAPTPFSSSSVSSSSPLATSTTTAASTAYANTNTNTKFNPFAFTSSSATSASVSTGASINPFAPAASSDAATATPNPFAPVRVAPTSSTTPPPPQLESQVANPVSSVPMTWPLPPTTNDDSVIGFEFEYRPEYLTTAYEPTGGTTMKVAASTSMESKLESDLTQQMGSLEVRNSSALAPGSGNASTRGPGTDGRKKNKDADFGLGGGDDDGEDQGEGDEYPRRREGKGSGGRRKKGAPSHASDKRVGGAGAGRSLTTTGGGEPGGWSGESYEVQRVAGVDDVFLAFQARVDREPTQLLRYDYGGTPLPFSSTSPATRLLFPSSSSSSTGPTGSYDRSKCPRCPTCGGPTTFELELMPNLVAVLNRNRQTSRQVPGRAPTGAEGDEDRDGDGLDWATVWVLSCVNECTTNGDGLGLEEAWIEAPVFVEWEE